MNGLVSWLLGNNDGPNQRRARAAQVPAAVHVLEPRALLSGVTYTVTTAADVGGTATANAGSLRQVINSANADGGNDTIVFDSTLFNATTPQTITLTGGALNIKVNLAIQADPLAQTVISGNYSSRIFVIDDGNVANNVSVSISGLVFAQAFAKIDTVSSNPALPNNGLGGAIFNRESLTLFNDTFNVNSAVSGGAVYNDATGRLASSFSQFNSNQASNDGGAVGNAGTWYSTNDLFVNNLAASAFRSGGAVYTAGTSATATALTALQTDEFDNNVSYNGGAVGVGNFGIVVSSASSYVGNSANNLGGALYVASNGTLHSVNDTIAKNQANASGGGVAVLGTAKLINDTVAANRAVTQTGGGLFNAGNLALANSIVVGNVRGATGNIATDILGNVINASNNVVSTAINTNLVNGKNGNIVGTPATALNRVLNTDGNGDLLLANNLFNPTLTATLTANSVAIGAGRILAKTAGPAISAAATTFAVDDATYLERGVSVTIGGNVLTAGMVINIDSEQMLVTGVSGNQLTVVRGFNGTTASAHGQFLPIRLAFDAVGNSRLRGIDAGAIQSNYAQPQLVVNNATDTPVVGLLSLREAIAQANLSGGGTITFDPSLAGATINLTAGELLVTGAVTIDGSGLGITITAAPNSRIFDFNDGTATPQTVSLVALTLSGANSGQNGGAIFNAENLTLSADTLINNRGVAGGAVYNTGTLNSVNTVYQLDSAVNAGGAVANIGGTFDSSGDTFSNDTAGTDGGAIYNFSVVPVTTTATTPPPPVATLLVNNGIFSSNVAAGFGGAIYNTKLSQATVKYTVIGGAGLGNAANKGGGIANNGILVANNDNVSANTAIAAGGGYYNDSFGNLTITDDRLAASLVRSRISANTVTGATGTGGGIYNAGVTKMTSTTVGGSTYTDGNKATNGAGIYNINTQPTPTTTTTTTTTTLPAFGTFSSSGNTIAFNTASGIGGGVYNAKTFNSANDTIAFNLTGTTRTVTVIVGTTTTTQLIVTAGIGTAGGGIADIAGSTFNATNDTIAMNVSANGGGIYAAPKLTNIVAGKTVTTAESAETIRNTIIAGNTASSLGADINGNIDSILSSLIGTAVGSTGVGVTTTTGAATGNIIGATVGQIFVVDPRSLKPFLADNGVIAGLPQTIALNPTGLAVDGGTNTYTATDAITGTTLLTDARGQKRIVNKRGTTKIDIGAFEVQ